MPTPSVRLDLKRLRLVIPVYSDDDSGQTRLYVYAQPIETEVLDAHFLVVAKTFAAMYAEGLGMLAGPQIAARMLREVAIDLGRWEPMIDPNDPDKKRVLKPGVRTHLIPAIHRLATVLVPTEKGGWDHLLFDDAVKMRVLDETDAREVDNAITFFTVALHMHRRAILLPMLAGAMELWGAEIRSCSSAEFVNSLTTSTADGSSGVTAAASLLTSSTGSQVRVSLSS